MPSALCEKCQVPLITCWHGPYGETRSSCIKLWWCLSATGRRWLKRFVRKACSKHIWSETGVKTETIIWNGSDKSLWQDLEITVHHGRGSKKNLPGTKTENQVWKRAGGTKWRDKSCCVRIGLSPWLQTLDFKLDLHGVSEMLYKSKTKRREKWEVEGGNWEIRGFTVSSGSRDESVFEKANNAAG